MSAVPQHRKRKQRPAPVTSGWTVRYALTAYVAVAAAAVAEGLLVKSLESRGAFRLGIGGVLLDATMLACLIPLYGRRAFRARDLGLRGAAPAKSVGWVVLALIVIAIVNALWVQGLLGLKQPDSLGITLRGSTVGLALAGLFMSLSAPVTEEIFFRGLLYRALRNRLSVARAAVIGGILFGLIHGLVLPLEPCRREWCSGWSRACCMKRRGPCCPESPCTA